MFKRTFRLRRPVREAVGIVISATSIKLLALVQQSKSYQISAYALAALPEGAILENQIRDTDIVISVIASLIRETKISTKNAAFAIADSLVLQRIVQLDALLSKREMEMEIYVTVKTYISFPLEHARLDYIVLGIAKNNPNKIDVLLVVVQAQLMNQYLRVLHLAGLDIKTVDVISHVIMRAALTLIPEVFAPILMVDHESHPELAGFVKYLSNCYPNTIDPVTILHLLQHLDTKIFHESTLTFLCAYGLAIRGLET